jgi:murein DD-endopeptidase MepM/ murein hydrolase activator NlpD
MSMRVAPLKVMKVTPHGAFGYVRRSSSDGGCGTKGFPCTHPGTDLAAAAGTPVYAPEDGVFIAQGDGTQSPFRGYGPWVAALAGASGKIHLLAHMHPSTGSLSSVGRRVVAGQQVGTIGVNHLHWEIRTKVTPPTGNNMDNNADAMAWLRGGIASSPLAAVIVLGGVALIATLWWRP